MTPRIWRELEPVPTIQAVDTADETLYVLRVNDEVSAVAHWPHVLESLRPDAVRIPMHDVGCRLGLSPFVGVNVEWVPSEVALATPADWPPLTAYAGEESPETKWHDDYMVTRYVYSGDRRFPGQRG